MPYANNKGADQPVVHRLDSIIPLLPIAEILRLLVVSVAEQAGLSLPWSQTLKTDFRGSNVIKTKTRYRKNPKISDTQKFAIITLKVEQDAFSLE